MKKALLTLAALAMAASAYAQGTITFWNSGIDSPSGGTTYDAPIRDKTGALASGAAFTAGLFIGESIVPGSQVTFLTGGGAGFFNPVFDLPIPNNAPGATPTFTVRAWSTSAGSFAAAAAGAGQFGKSDPFVARQLGGANPTPPPPSFFTPTLTGLQSFQLQEVPEPSTIALGAIGIGALLLRRRK
jgi:hypothetical protein